MACRNSPPLTTSQLLGAVDRQRIGRSSMIQRTRATDGVYVWGGRERWSFHQHGSVRDVGEAVTIKADLYCFKKISGYICSSNLSVVQYAMACCDHLFPRRYADSTSLQVTSRRRLKPYCDAAFASKGTNSEASFAAITSASSSAYPWGLRSSTA